MKRKFLLALLLIAIGVLVFGVISVSADTYGDLTYTVSNGKAIITDCNESASGEIVIPNTIDGYPVTAIGDRAFYGCTGLTSVSIPDGVISIGNSAFRNSTGLISVTIPDSVTSIGYSAFENCKGLTRVNITDIAAWCNIEFSHYYANPLNYANNLYLNDEIVTDLIIPEGVTTIGNNAFYNCTGLISVTIPDSVTTIGYRAFYECTGLTSVNVTDIAAWCKVEFDDSSSNPLYYARTLYLNNELVTNLVIPDGVTFISEYAFYRCTGIASVTIPDSVTTISDGAFYGCAGLTKINITDIATWCNIEFGGYSTTPQYYAEKLYLNNELVTKLIIPDGVTTIGNYAFYGCSDIVSVTIPDSVTTIGYRAFYECTGLTNITIGAGTEAIYDHAFYRCTGLTSLTIPDGVTQIGDEAFYGCTGLTSVIIPDSVASIGNDAFAHCMGLTNVIIPDGITTISDNVFAGCTGITNATISDSVTTIGESVFSYCTTLTNIIIPDSVITIGKGAFRGCTNLTDVYYEGTEDAWNEIVICTENEALINATIHYNYVAPSEYKINSITLKDASGNELDEIPTGNFLATVSFTNVSSSADTVIVLAQYNEAGAFKGLMYIQTEDVPTGATIKLTIPVDNTGEDVASLKAFCWESFSSFTPMGNTVTFE